MSPEDLRAAETRLRDGLAHLERRARIPAAPSIDALGDARAQAAAQRFLTRLAAMTRRTITTQTQIADRLRVTATAYQSREDAITGRFHNLPTDSRLAHPVAPPPAPIPRPPSTPQATDHVATATPPAASAPAATPPSTLGRITPRPPSAAQTNHLAPAPTHHHGNPHGDTTSVPNEIGYIPGQIRDVLEHTQDRFIGPRLRDTPASTSGYGGARATEGS